MGKLGALAILLALAAIIYFFSPGSQVQVAKKQARLEAIQPEAVESRQAKDAQPSNSQIQSSNPQIQSSNPQIQSSNSIEPLHDHIGHDSDEKTEIPQYITDSLETKRIPASELIEEKQADGSSYIDLKGQYQHVPVAVIGEDGKVKIIETRIEPIADQ